MAFDAFALMLAMLALGMLFARLRVFPEGAADTLNLVVLYVCLPAAILLYVPKLRFAPELLGLVLVPWLLAAASWLLLRVLAPRLRLRRDELGVLLLCTMLGNTSFIGYPMIQALLGPQALPYAVVYDQFGTFVMLPRWACWCWRATAASIRPRRATSPCASCASRRSGPWSSA